MIAAQRQGLIVDYLRKHGAGSITELAVAVRTSRSSTRRDLDRLGESGLIVRTRGGAIIADQHRTTFEPPRRLGAKTSAEQKTAIARAAIDLLKPGQSVIFDSSSTVFEVARLASERNIRLTACTNDIDMARTLASASEIRLVLLGGTVRPNSMTLVGEPGIGFLERLHVDIAFIGIHSLAGGRLSETSIEVADIKKRMIESATQAIVLADSSKFAHPAFCDVCSLSRMATLITNAGVDESARTTILEAGVETIVAGEA